MQSCVSVPEKKLHPPTNRERNVRNHRTIDLPDSDLIKARSIRNKFLDLEELVAAEKFDIIAITESWLNTKTETFLRVIIYPGIPFSVATEKTEQGVALFCILTVIFIHVQYRLKKSTMSI